MKFSLDTSVGGSHQEARVLDTDAVFEMCKLIRAVLLDRGLEKYIDLVQCRFNAPEASGPLEINFHVVMRCHAMASALKYELDASARVDWQRGGSERTSAHVVQKIEDRLRMIAESFTELALQLNGVARGGVPS